jgi:hypothetical protein
VIEMAREVNRINISNNPELLRLVETAKNAQMPVVLEQDDEEVAIIRSIKKPVAKRTRGRAMSTDDPLWKLVGTGESAEPTDIKTHKDEYLGEAYAAQPSSE